MGNNNKSYRLITHSPITRPPPLNAERCSITLPPPSITPFIMHLIWPPVWLSVQWEALQTLHSLYLRVCVFMCWGCWQEWKTAFGGVWAHASVYRIYWDVWSCVEMCEWEHGRSTEVYKSNRMIVLPLWSTLSQQVHSSFFFPFFSFLLSLCFLPSLSVLFSLPAPPPPPPLLRLLLCNRFVWGPLSNLQQCRVLGDGRQILISNWAL